MLDALFGIVVVAGCAFVASGWSLPWYVSVLLVVVADVALVVPAQADNAPRNVSIGSLLLLRFVVVRRLSL